jgi:hypothetical protein
MQVERINHSPQFGAIHVATCDKINLYKVANNSDVKYLKSLPAKIKMEELLPGLTKRQYERWHEMLEYAIDMMQNPGNTTYIETLNNKICGIITYFPDKTTIIDCICTWPAQVGQKVKMGGKTLFYQVFRDFEKNKGTRIKLDAITDGPFNTIKKYEPLGFKRTSTVHPTKVEMEANKYKVKETLSELGELIRYKETKPENINIQELI